MMKIADDELEFITGEPDSEKGAKQILDKYKIPLVCVTRGRNGAVAYCSGTRVEAPAFAVENVVDTTGAGDAFCACMINAVINNGGCCIDSNRLLKMLEFSNAASALVIKKRGALKSMPQIGEIEELILSHNTQ